ncbi:EpsG family protein [Acinetobacter parvus]
MLFFSILLEKCSDINLKIISYICLVSFLVMLAGLRGNVEPDYSSYLDIFTNARMGGEREIEPGFFYFNKILNNFGMSFQWVIFLIALFSITLKLNFFFKNSPNFAFSILIYYCSMFFLYDFIAIRQALSMAIFMISIRFIIDRKFFHYAALIAIASMIHLSALVLIPLYFFIHYSYNKVLFYLVLLLTTSVSVLKVDIQLVSLLLNYFALPDFASNKLDIYTQEDVFAALSGRQLLLGFVFVFFLSKNDNKIIQVLLNIYILGIVIGTLFNEVPQMSFRLKAYFLWTESVLVVFYICKIFKNYYLLRIFAYFVLVALYFYSLYGYLDVLSQRHNGYIYPYKFFFE